MKGSSQGLSFLLSITHPKHFTLNKQSLSFGDLLPMHYLDLIRF